MVAVAQQAVQRTTTAFLEKELPTLVAQRIQECRDVMESAQKTIEACCGQEPDAADRASNEEECAAARARYNRAEETLAKLKARKRELQCGFQGYCTDCGEEIGDGRLQLRPEATRCVECKDTHTRSQSQYGAV